MDNGKKHQSSLSHCRGIDHLHLEGKPVCPRRRIKDSQTFIVAPVEHTGHMIEPEIAYRSEATSAIRLDTHYNGKRKNRQVCVCHCVGMTVVAGYRTSGYMVTPDESLMGENHG
jgi:hypothetical protein